MIKRWWLAIDVEMRRLTKYIRAVFFKRRTGMLKELT